MPKRERRPPGSISLWMIALLVALLAGVWQWHTGAARPMRGEVEIAGHTVPYQLPSSGTAGEPLRVTVGAPPEVTGMLRWRHSLTGEPFQGLTMLRDEDVLVGLLPAQPAGGQLEYQLVLVGAFGLARIPADEPVAIRSRGSVSAVTVLPYLVASFLSLLAGAREQGLAALFARPEARLLTWITAGSVTVCGMVLGPIVQRSAFGTYWTGWPHGANPIDNEALVAWLAWMVAAATMASARATADRFARTVVVLATTALIAVALLPHSLHVSRLDDPAQHAGASVSDGYSTEASEGRPSSS